MTKKLRNWIIIVTVVFCSYNFTVLAETVTFNTVTEALNYNGNKSTVTKIIITGKISGNDYSASSEWSKFRTFDKTFPNIEEVEILTDQDIPDGASPQEEGALFSDSSYSGSIWLKNFSAPNVTNIGEGAFAFCSNLVSVNFPLVTNIGESAFVCCYNLVSVNFPLLTNIENWTFTGCLKLASVNFPLVTNIMHRAFYYCSNLVSVNFPLVTNIGDWAFRDCENLISVNFPLVTNIGESAFVYCYNLVSVNFPLVTNIGEGAFYYCKNLVSVNFPLVTNIGNRAFGYCSNLSSVNFLLVTNIGNRAFGYCSNLVSATFGTGFETKAEIKFGEDVFYSVETKNVDLILGENVLPAPDLTTNTWQSNRGNGQGNPYTWKSITKFSSIEEIIKNSTVSIYPNPTVGNATVSFELERSCNMKILLCDVLGIELMNVYDGFADAGTFTNKINIGHLPKGVYFLKILIDGNYITEKIILE